MPHSLVFHCIAEEDFGRNTLRGEGLRHLVISLLDQLTPQIGQQVATARERPFTVSPFFARRRSQGTKGGVGRDDRPFRGERIEAGTRCRFRLTLLEDKLYQIMTGIIGRPDLILSIKGQSLRVSEVLSSKQESDPWPRSQTYQQLRDQASSTRKELRLQFVTPTTLSRRGGTLPLPDPQVLFTGYLKSWNWFAFLPLSTDLEKLIERHVFLKDFGISAVKYETGAGIRPAFTGWSQFVLIGRHHEKHIKEFNLLADYSFYCGTGDYTDVGMGVTQRL